MDEKLAQNYQRAYRHSVGYGDRPALVLVDFVAAYFDESCPLFADVDDALASALRILGEARNAGIPIAYTNVVYQPGGADGGMFFRKVPVLENFVAGHPMGAWASGIAPAEGELVISKQYPSAFFGTSLASTLHSKGIDTFAHHWPDDERLCARDLRRRDVARFCADHRRGCLRGSPRRPARREPV